MENVKTYLYIYRMTSDTGFAPCVDDGLFTLACCKGGKIRNEKVIPTGLRYHIGTKRNSDYTSDDVYVMGTYKNKLLYLARITDVVTMKEYFAEMSKGRVDDIYSLVKGKLVRNGKLRIKDVGEDIHIDSNQIKRDIAGEYVLISNDYLYLGEDAVFLDIVKKYNAKTHETKYYNGDVAKRIIKECLKYQDGKIHNPMNPLKKKGIV